MIEDLWVNWGPVGYEVTNSARQVMGVCNISNDSLWGK